MDGPKHTPGEWYAIRHEHGGPPSNGECYRIEIRGNPFRLNGKVYGSEPVCVLHSGFVHFEGNAALLLAAPDLLAACELWDQGFAEGEQFTAEQFRKWVNDNRRAARAAIAKAKGAT